MQGDLSQLDDVPAVRGRSFDQILFLQSLGYAAEQAATLRAARRLLSADGFIVFKLRPAHPSR